MPGQMLCEPLPVTHFCRKLTFDLEAPGRFDIYVVSVSGGSPRLLIEDGVSPSWSHDGRWVYFASERSGGRSAVNHRVARFLWVPGRF